MIDLLTLLFSPLPNSVCLVFPGHFPFWLATSGQYLCDVSVGADRHAHFWWNW